MFVKKMILSLPLLFVGMGMPNMDRQGMNMDRKGRMEMGRNMEMTKFPSKMHRDAYMALGEKHKMAYSGLSHRDRNRIVRDYRNGMDHHTTLATILREDMDRMGMSKREMK